MGAILDRNGLRPSRYYVTDDDYLILSSEDGVLDIDPTRIVVKERLRPGKSEVFRLCGDNHKICSLTSWRPEIDLREGLRRTAEWLVKPENMRLYKANIYNR